MRALTGGLLDLLLPPLCVRCGARLPRGSDLCDACLRALPGFTDPDPNPSGIAFCSAGLAYRGEVLEWVRRWKYPPRGLAGLDAAAAGFVRGVIRRAAAAPSLPHPDLVVPVPLHPRRLRQRGFNPAMLLARTAARTLRAPSDATALRRVRDTRSQTDLGSVERRRNVRDAFRARPGVRFPPTVWLVDDVVTTGSTVAEAGRALSRAGARTVVVVCAARTPRTQR
jgi:ComF family protein